MYRITQNHAPSRLPTPPDALNRGMTTCLIRGRVAKAVANSPVVRQQTAPGHPLTGGGVVFYAKGFTYAVNVIVIFVSE